MIDAIREQHEKLGALRKSLFEVSEAQDDVIEGQIEIYPQLGIEEYLDDISKAVSSDELGEHEKQGLLEKAKKDLSKLQKKVITDKNGKRKTVYVKVIKGDKTIHPSQKHADAVAVYQHKKKYMSSADAKAHVEKHFGKEHADYSEIHDKYEKNRAKEAGKKSDKKSGSSKSSSGLSNHFGEEVHDGIKVGDIVEDLHGDLVTVDAAKDGSIHLGSPDGGHRKVSLDRFKRAFSSTDKSGLGVGDKVTYKDVNGKKHKGFVAGGNHAYAGKKHVLVLDEEGSRIDNAVPLEDITVDTKAADVDDTYAGLSIGDSLITSKSTGIMNPDSTSRIVGINKDGAHLSRNGTALVNMENMLLSGITGDKVASKKQVSEAKEVLSASLGDSLKTYIATGRRGDLRYEAFSKHPELFDAMVSEGVDSILSSDKGKKLLNLYASLYGNTNGEAGKNDLTESFHGAVQKEKESIYGSITRRAKELEKKSKK